MKVILGTKIGMTQIIGEDGLVTPVTILQAGPATVTQIKTVDTDGYNAVQLGYGQGKNLSKSVSAHVKKADETLSPKILKEFRTDSTPELKLGDTLTVESFELGDKVAVTGISKGKGFAGTVKRWNFQESRNTHGFKGNIRRVGSIGSMYPQKVFKGKDILPVVLLTSLKMSSPLKKMLKIQALRSLSLKLNRLALNLFSVLRVATRLLLFQAT